MKQNVKINVQSNVVNLLYGTIKTLVSKHMNLWFRPYRVKLDISSNLVTKIEDITSKGSKIMSLCRLLSLINKDLTTLNILPLKSKKTHFNLW